jgi:solute carrier family 8 (sodium/calcium exchanger)
LKTEAISAEEGKDYEAVDQEVVFEANAITKTVEIPIIDQHRYTCNNTFRCTLSEPRCVGLEGKTVDVEIKTSEHTECIVTIVADENTKKLYDDVSKLAKLKLDDYKLGTATWAEQFKEALFQIGEDDDEGGDEGGDPGTVDYVMHFITVPWKLFFALVPPTDYWGGTVCFVVALAFIGIVTCLIGDLAAILGCLIKLPDSITAITLVALGTSLPDTFASKAAAISDDNADASIGNVTGSNGVNVFLGIGLPWAMAAFYWTGAIGACEHGTADADQSSDCDLKLFGEWSSRMGAEGKTFGEHGYPVGFIVEGGSLGLSVITFCACAGIAIAVLYYRRVTYGAELGGPKGGFLGATMTSYLFTLLWFTYIGVSIVVVAQDGGFS